MQCSHYTAEISAWLIRAYFFSNFVQTRKKDVIVEDVVIGDGDEAINETTLVVKYEGQLA